MTGVLFGYVGLLCLRREATGEARLALVAFATWWLGAAALTVLGTAHTWFAAIGLQSPILHDAILLMRVPSLAAALWGLLSYLAYLLTGRRFALSLGLFETAFALLAIYLFLVVGPFALVDTTWETRYVPENVAPATVAPLFGALLAGPIVVAAVAYAALYVRVKDRTPRFRIGLIALAFIGWFGALIAAFALGWQRTDMWFFANNLPGLLAGLLVLLAYRPPRWLQRRYGIEPFLPQEARA